MNIFAACNAVLHVGERGILWLDALFWMMRRLPDFCFDLRMAREFRRSFNHMLKGPKGRKVTYLVIFLSLHFETLHYYVLMPLLLNYWMASTFEDWKSNFFGYFRIFALF